MIISIYENTAAYTTEGGETDEVAQHHWAGIIICLASDAFEDDADAAEGDADGQF